MEICTIGFTQKPAAEFFGALRQAGIKRLVDIRLRNSSQLAGFAKRTDLAYFLKELCGAEYVAEPLLAPTDDLLDAYRKKLCSWEDYEPRFFGLLSERNVERHLDPELFDGPTVLLCSEAKPNHCHRRLVIEHLQRHWSNVTARHL